MKIFLEKDLKESSVKNILLVIKKQQKIKINIKRILKLIKNAIPTCSKEACYSIAKNDLNGQIFVINIIEKQIRTHKIIYFVFIRLNLSLK